MSSLSVYSAESGGEKRNYSLFMDDRSNNDSNDGVNVDDNEIDYGGANDFMGRIPKNMTAVHQVTLLFQEYDESKPKAAETTNVTVNLFNFISAMAGDRVRTGSTSDLKAVFGRAEEYFSDAYENFPKKNDAINKFFQYIPDVFNSTWPPLFQQYVAEMRDEEPSRDWLKRHSSIPNKDPDILKKYYFGYRVFEAYGEVKLVINNHLNKLFIKIRQE